MNEINDNLKTHQQYKEISLSFQSSMTSETKQREVKYHFRYIRLNISFHLMIHCWSYTLHSRSRYLVGVEASLCAWNRECKPILCCHEQILCETENVSPHRRHHKEEAYENLARNWAIIIVVVRKDCARTVHEIEWEQNARQQFGWG